jgi:hypothetical protein
MSLTCLQACNADKNSLDGYSYNPSVPLPDGLELSDGTGAAAPAQAGGGGSTSRQASVLPDPQRNLQPQAPPVRGMIDGRPYFRISGKSYGPFAAEVGMTTKQDDITVYQVSANRGNCDVTAEGTTSQYQYPFHLRFGDTLRVHTQCNPLELELWTDLGWLAISLASG